VNDAEPVTAQASSLPLLERISFRAGIFRTARYEPDKFTKTFLFDFY
jgi:hypothetical protein